MRQDEIIRLNEEIEQLRQKLYETAQWNASFCNQNELLSLSHKLDVLIVKQMKLNP